MEDVTIQEKIHEKRRHQICAKFKQTDVAGKLRILQELNAALWEVLNDASLSEELDSVISGYIGNIDFLLNEVIAGLEPYQTSVNTADTGSYEEELEKEEENDADKTLVP